VNVLAAVFSTENDLVDQAAKESFALSVPKGVSLPKRGKGLAERRERRAELARHAQRNDFVAFSAFVLDLGLRLVESAKCSFPTAL
jgi:hypothetical protein